MVSKYARTNSPSGSSRTRSPSNLAGIVDVEAEMDRLNKQAETLEKGLKGLDAKLNNEKFVQNAKPEVVARERDRRVELREKYDQVQAVLKSLAEA